MSNTNFGKNILTNNFDASILEGWGVRPSDWNLGVSLQQQIGPRASVDVAYIRRAYRGYSVADNLALQPSDLTPFSIVAPRWAHIGPRSYSAPPASDFRPVSPSAQGDARGKMT